MSLIIRPEQPADRAAALEVERAAFGSDVEPAIIEAVRDEPGSFALIAVQDGEVVGHVQFSRAWIGDEPVLALGPIGVIHAQQRRGIGAALIRGGIGEARRLGERTLMLLGSPAYYARFGFKPASRSGVATPYPQFPEEDFMLLHLDDPRGGLAGEARFHPAFG